LTIYEKERTVDAQTRVALVTGANRGVGLEVARKLGRLGYLVLVGARNAERGEAAAKELRDEGIDAEAIALDVAREASVFAAAAEVRRRFERLDLLVNNAAVNYEFAQGAWTPSQVPLDVLKATYETNVFGTFLAIRHFLPLLRASRDGRIVNVSSSLGSLTRQATPGSPGYGATTLAYNSSKAAINAMTVQFAHDLAGARIKVNAVDPGLVATDMTVAKGSAPVTRTAEEGAEVIVRIASNGADAPTGGFFDADGEVPW
jgi:NAD(P)-dependent dehydrogenase (short-subunit alcohol dehydrogenase family)